MENCIELLQLNSPVYYPAHGKAWLEASEIILSHSLNSKDFLLSNVNTLFEMQRSWIKVY